MFSKKLAAALFLAVLNPPGAIAQAIPSPVFPPGGSWDWQLSAPVDLSRRVRVLDIDPELVSRRDIERLKARKVYLVCYVSIGTLEKGRPDARRFPRAVIGRVYGDWPDERFLDIRRLDILLPIMRARFRRCKELGFDAVEADNMDVHDNHSGFAISRADTLRYVKVLARAAHGMGLAMAQKNVPELSPQLVSMLDFAIAESCFQDGWCGKMAPWLRAGKPVLDAEYRERPLDMKAACETARRLSISLIVKDRDLTKWRKSCPR